MPSLADVLRRHGPAYLERYRGAVLPSHVRAMEAIVNCRTAAMGGHLAQCEQCGKSHLLFHSCRHRACPQCGYDTTEKWLQKQRELLLPVPHFHVVFTLPAELRRVVRSHQRELLSVLFRAAFDSLSALCQDPRFLGGQVGTLAVLHTWTRTLEWHPHIHMLVPGGALGPDQQTWIPVPKRRKQFLVPVRALAKHFRGRFLDLARRALPDIVFPKVRWNKTWVVFAKPTVQGAERVLEYLGRYVHRTALGNSAILSCDEHVVTFRYLDSSDHQRKTMTLPAHEFLRRFLQHVLPKGFHRVRAFGLLHSTHRSKLRRLRLMLESTSSTEWSASGEQQRESPRVRCPHCRTGTLRLLRRLSAEECFALIDTPLPARLTKTAARAPPTPNTVTTAGAAA